MREEGAPEGIVRGQETPGGMGDSGRREPAAPQAGSGYCAETKAPTPHAPTRTAPLGSTEQVQEMPRPRNEQSQAAGRELATAGLACGRPRIHFLPLPPQPLQRPQLVWAALSAPGTALTAATASVYQLPRSHRDRLSSTSSLPSQHSKLKVKAQIAARKMETLGAPWIQRSCPPPPTPHTTTHSNVPV